jgi:hypothetical protein
LPDHLQQHSWKYKIQYAVYIAGVGLMLAVVGNYIYNIKPNYFAGIRLPWTLHNDENWKRTHLLGGKLLLEAAAYRSDLPLCIFHVFDDHIICSTLSSDPYYLYLLISSCTKN